MMRGNPNTCPEVWKRVLGKNTLEFMAITSESGRSWLGQMYSIWHHWRKRAKRVMASIMARPHYHQRPRHVITIFLVVFLISCRHHFLLLLFFSNIISRMASVISHHCCHHQNESNVDAKHQGHVVVVGESINVSAPHY